VVHPCLTILAVMPGVGHVSPDKGIGGTSKRWRFSYVIVAAYPSLLAKLKLGCLCALLRGPPSAHRRLYCLCCSGYLPFLTSKIKA